VCVNLKQDPHNCGQCNNTCLGNDVCANGVCSQTCPSGLTDCYGHCVNTQTDVNNCASCGNRCPTAEVGSCQKVICSGGSCAQVCDSTNTPQYPSYACYFGVCNNCQPGLQNKPAETPCNYNGGKVCDGNGNCAQCVSASDCPTPSNPCQVAVCNPGTYGGTCGTQDVADNTQCGTNHVCCSGVCYALGNTTHCTSCTSCAFGKVCCPGNGCFTACP
jgi:hypothetical protein